jgi:hypothetical protein
MNAMLRLTLTLALGTSVATIAAAQESVKVASSRELRVAIVDSTKASQTRDAMHQAFATSLGSSLTQQCGAPVGVRAKCVGVDNAAFNFGAGVYDAVLVVGRSIPDALRRTESITLSAAIDGGKRERMVYLLIANGDSSLQGLLAAAFANAINDGKFVASFAGTTGKLATPAGDKLATAQ